MLYGISIVLVSIISISSLLLSRQSNAVELLNKVRVYQGRIGVVAVVLGICQLINWYLDNAINKTPQIWSVSVFLACMMQINLGLLLGFPMFREKISIPFKSIHFSLVSWAHKQGIAGIIALALGTWIIVASFLYEN